MYIQCIYSIYMPCGKESKDPVQVVTVSFPYLTVIIVIYHLITLFICRCS